MRCHVSHAKHAPRAEIHRVREGAGMARVCLRVVGGPQLRADGQAHLHVEGVHGGLDRPQRRHGAGSHLRQHHCGQPAEVVVPFVEDAALDLRLDQPHKERPVVWAQRQSCLQQTDSTLVVQKVGRDGGRLEQQVGATRVLCYGLL